MARTLQKSKGRAETGSFFLIPHVVLRNAVYTTLSAWAVKLLVDIGAQFNGKNNGDLCAPYSMMKKLGWKSPGTLNKARKELLAKGFIEMTRQGGLNKCSLFALTWNAIDDCRGKLDVDPTNVPSNLWKKN